jgi:twitching motility protein PilT
MSLVPSLLQAILKVDGEALVMHASEKPYVVAPAGQIELASRGLTLEAVDGIVGQLLPPELQRALDEFGAVQYELPAAPEFPREHFTVVAARGGDDLWVEIRRRRVPAEDDRVPDDLFPPRGAPAGVAAAVVERPVAVATPPVAVAALPIAAQPLVAPPAIAATVAPAVIEPPVVVPPAVPQVVAVPSAAPAIVAEPVIAPPVTPPVHAVEIVPAPVAAEPSTIADAAPVAEMPSTHAQPVSYQETFAGHEAVAHYEPVMAREPFVHHKAAALHEAVVHEPLAHDARADQAVAARQESIAYQEPVREDEVFEEEIEDDDLSFGEFGKTQGWYEQEGEGEKEINEDDGLTLPDAELLFGKRRAAETDYDEQFEEVGELLEGEEYEEGEEFEDGDEFEIGLDVPAPSQPGAAQVQTPPPAMFAPPPVPTSQAPVSAEALFQTAPPSVRVEAPLPSVFGEVSQPFLLVAPPIVEAPRPLAQGPPNVVVPPMGSVPEPLPAPHPAFVVEEPWRVAEATPFVSEPPLFETSAPHAVVEEPPVVAEVPPAEPAFETPASVAEVPVPVAEVEPSFVSEPPAFETSAWHAVVEEPHPVAEMAPPEPAFETSAPVAEVEPSFVSEPSAFESSTPHAVVEEPRMVAEMAPPEPAFATHAPVFETPEPAADVPQPVVEAVATFETREPVAEGPSAVLEASPWYAEQPLSVAAPPPAPVFELVAPVFETETVEEIPPPPVEAFAAHAELPFPVVEATLPTATLSEPPAESAVESAQPDVEPAPDAEPSESWAAWVPPPATVLSMSRNPIRSTDFQPPTMPDPTMSGLDRLLRVSAARGASTLYLSTDAQPSVRVDGELQTIDGEPVLSARDVESLLLTLMPERSHEALRTGAATEWFCDIDVVGRVRCLSFRDHRGPGGVFRLMPTRSVSVDQLGLPRSVQALAIEPEGLVLVAGPRSSGKRTLLSAFVDQINKTRRDHIITIEREVNIVHEQSSSFVSQREVRGNDDDMMVAARAALREDPDVLVIEDLRTAALMNVALEAASAGRLVVAGFSAHTAAGAIDRIIDLYPPENRGQVQLALADCLRGVIVQVLLRRTAGGRVPAREVLLNTPAVSSVIAEGKTSQLAMAIEGGRRYGMLPINDGLVSLVQSGVVDAREAYRRSTDRPGFLAALKRHGIDTSFVERLA